MGLALEVGILADLKENDPEGFEYYATCFANVNDLLAQHGLSAHSEPTGVSVWGADMYGYSGLHYLRRLAAFVDSGVELPGPGDRSSSKDARLEGYFNDVTGEGGGVLKSLFRKKPEFKREFDHLIVHSDAEGFYLPIDFPESTHRPRRSDGCWVAWLGPRLDCLPSVIGWPTYSVFHRKSHMIPMSSGRLPKHTVKARVPGSNTASSPSLVLPFGRLAPFPSKLAQP